MSSTTQSSVTKDEFSEVNDDGFDHLHSHHLPSRLSVCNSSFTGDDQSVDGRFLGTATMSMSALSIDSFDADVEVSAASDSGKAGQRCNSLPTTPPRRHRRRAGPEKEYMSENEAREGSGKRVPSGRSSRRSGGSPSGGGAAAVVAITRPKGGRKSLRMDWQEVKACHELGLELEDQKMLEVLPRPAAASGRSLDYQSSSGGNSPISSWCISSPDDNPKEVKARLKVWAQAVALFSTSTNFNSNFR